MIEFRNVSKEFTTNHGNLYAVRDVSFKVEAGEIFGVIGYSGAGKSTLVRCINLLEKPSSGDVVIDGVVMNDLSERDLRDHRRKIGMIFQQFNLMASRTVFDNVALSLVNSKMTKHEIHDKVTLLLDLVGIQDKAHAYPSQLSGGQKQRVAIARALANDPKILLCDEATSALDPQTTTTILKLLKEVNEKLGITIVIITHEMSVIKDICDRVAVMEAGQVKELTDVVSIFSKPQAQISKDFVNNTTNMNELSETLTTNPGILNLKEGQVLLRIDFYGESTKDSVISYISRTFEVNASIVFANIEVVKEDIIGSMVIILSGERKAEALAYLNTIDVKVEVY
ncbi:ATP-binding cassette domain-containing protein [Erysipelothrix sp. HDW6C]|uniref:methionine ABC transporter ATP-binding protein n=1 Tax=Erysipelothrix sp. HDW6C TaxID=2714930 RepID=UPI00140B8758|nr:ATP-binding cassette domain-containing protein [Erysipelothrix sp. HDW6C]QIK69042.1 ATP-binding cassette domain-containing protein [Erysipelothrix sp. HDW6C]